MESKKDIRKKIFAERKLRTDEQIEAMSLTITDKVTALPAFKNATAFWYMQITTMKLSQSIL